MRIRRGNNVMVNVLLIALIIAGAGLVYYVIQMNSATPATITPNLVQIGAGQTASITVSWSAVGESVPYTVYLYQSPTSGSCGTSFTLVAAKTGLPTPGFTFNVNPTTTSYYCGTVAGEKGSSAVSSITTVTIGPVLTTPTLSISPSSIDSGQSVTVAATVKWTQGVAPYTVTLYTGSNSTCSFDTTKAALVSGSNPSSSLTGTSTTFSVKDPVSTNYYCATVTDSATVPHTVTSTAVGFSVVPDLSVAITPDYPIVDSGQPVTLTAVPAHGLYPYSYQWYTGLGCSPGTQMTGQTSSNMTTGPLTSTVAYSVSVTDASAGSPQARVCTGVSGAVSSPFNGTSVAVSPSGFVLDTGQSATLVVSWTSAGTLPYEAQLYSSSTSGCQAKTAVGLPHVLSGITTNFTVSPSSNTYYCVLVKDGAVVPESAPISAGVLVAVNPTIAPTFTLSPLDIDTGQAATVTAKVTWTGGTSPYSVTLYSGTNTNCVSDTTEVAVLSGNNPQTGITGTSATFSFSSPAADTYYCAKVTDRATKPVSVLVPVPPSPNAAAPAVQFTLNPALVATISPPTPIIDNGSSITLTASAKGTGTSSWFYQWYNGLTCAAGSAISGQTTSSYSTGAIKSTTSYSVAVTDSSIGTPAAQSCAGVTVTVNPALDPSLVLSHSASDAGQTPAIVATVSWKGGTSPYSITLYAGTSAKCASDTTIVKALSGSNPQTGVIGTSTTVTFTAPTADTEYCATVEDSATVQVTVSSPVLLFIVNPALAAPSFVLSLSTVDAGQTATVTAHVAWTGGTSPYSVTLYSGTSASCSADATVTAVLPDGNPQSGLTALNTTFSFTAPAATTDYCAVVTDGSALPESVASASIGQFTVNPVLTVTVSPPSKAVDSGQPYVVTLTAITSGGTAPYLYQWYQGSSCSNGAISGQTSSSFSPGEISSTTTYSVGVIDSSTGTPAASACASSTIIVNPALSIPALTVSSTASPTLITATVTWSGGTSPYSISIYSGTSNTCSYDTTVASSKTGVVGTSTSFSLSTPASSTYYCATLTDSAPVPVAVTTSTVLFTVNPALMVAISPAAPTIDSGQSITLTATASSGVSPYHYQWYNGPACWVAISGQTTSSYVASTLSTAQYSVEVTDTSTPTPNTACSTITVTVNTAFVGTPVTIAPSAVVDLGQSVTLKVSWSSAGTPTYSVQLMTSSTTSCSSPTPFESQTAITGTPVNFTIMPTSSWYYCATVTDSAHSPESSSTTVVVSVSVKPALSTPALTLSPSAIDVSQEVTVTATVTWSGGVSPYAVVLESGPSSSCASDTTVVTVSGYNPQSDLTGTSATFSFTFTGSTTPSTTYYCAKVTDSATVPVSVTSSSAALTVNPALAATVSPSLPKIDSGQSVVLTAMPSAGTPNYYYQWYNGLTCAAGSAIPGRNSSSYSTGALSLTASFSVLVTDRSPGIPGASNCAQSTVTVDAALTATIDPVSQSIDNGQSVTLKAVPAGGTQPYFYQWYQGLGCVGVNALEGYTSQSYFTGPLTTTTNFSVSVGDNSVGTPAASVCAGVTVTVNPALAAEISPSAPKIDSGQSITLTANPLGGTTPYSYQWYSGSSATCSSDTTKLGTASTQSVNPTSSVYYCYVLKDASGGNPAASATSATDLVTVSPALATPTMSPSSRTIDSGRSITLTVSWSGGTSTYTVVLYSSPTSSCSSGSTLVSTNGAVTGSPTTFSVSPTTDAYYCATVTDSANSPSTTPASSADLITVNAVLVANAISPSTPTIDSGQSITLTANPLGGTTPYSYQWYSGSSATCSSDTTKLGTASTQSVNPTSSVYYCYTVTDASTNAPTVSSATDLVTVSAALTAGTVSPSAPKIDSGQSITLTANPLGGTTPYSYQWYSGSSATCSSDTTKLGTASTQSVNPTSSTYYCYVVKDASAGTPAASATSATDLVSVNPALVAPVISVLDGSISVNGNSTLSTTTGFSGGTTTYKCQWLVEAPGATSYSDLGGSFACTASSLPTISTGTLSLTGTYYFELEVTDSSTVPNTVASTPVTVAVS